MTRPIRQRRRYRLQYDTRYLAYTSTRYPPPLVSVLYSSYLHMHHGTVLIVGSISNGSDARVASVMLRSPQKSYQESKGSGMAGERVLGARLQPGLTISENSAEVFATRFAPDGK